MLGQVERRWPRLGVAGQKWSPLEEGRLHVCPPSVPAPDVGKTGGKGRVGFGLLERERGGVSECALGAVPLLTKCLLTPC